MKKVALFRIKDGQKERWHQWCQELVTHLREEALLTLQEEKVLQELAIGFSVGGVDYVLGYMDGECLPPNMDREINQRHKAMKQMCLERAGDDLKLLYELQSN